MCGRVAAMVWVVQYGLWLVRFSSMMDSAQRRPQQAEFNNSNTSKNSTREAECNRARESKTGVFKHLCVLLQIPMLLFLPAHLMWLCNHHLQMDHFACPGEGASW